MWKLNKFSAIFSVLFFSFLACISPLTILKANAVESYRISPEDERNFKRSIYRTSGISETENIDLHYYFYASNNYSEDISLIIYTCDYLNNRILVKKEGCGLYMVNEGGYFKIKISSSYYSTAVYSRRNNNVKNFNYFNSSYSSGKLDLVKFTDEDFKRGLTLLGGTTLKENSWNREEGGFLFEPIGGNSGSSSNNNSSVGGFNPIGDIAKALGEFFRPMIESLNATVDWLSKLGSTIVNGITDFFRGLVDIVVNIWNFLSNFFVKLIEELGKFVKWIFVPSDDSLNNIFSNFKSEFDKAILPFNNFIQIDILKTANSYYVADCNSYSDGNVIRRVDLCGVPPMLLNWCRIFVNFALGLWTIYRILGSIPIFLGSYYIWERWNNFEQERSSK